MPVVLRLAVALALLPFRFAFALAMVPLRAVTRALTRPLRLGAARRRLARAYRTLGVAADGVIRVRDRRFTHPAVF